MSVTTMRVPGVHGATKRARCSRREETDAEYRLWYRLSGRELGGFKFVRQVPLGPYVVDFLCRSRRLIVELDGEQHAENARCDEQLPERHGYSVLRFWNRGAAGARSGSRRDPGRPRGEQMESRVDCASSDRSPVGSRDASPAGRGRRDAAARSPSPVLISYFASACTVGSCG